jgi:hypothetical protein
MSLNDVLDVEVVLAGVVEIEVDIALGVDDSGDAIGGHDVRGVGETAEKELLDQNWFHEYVLELSLLDSSRFRFFPV